jgi:galactose mutarotase-like enzyme
VLSAQGRDLLRLDLDPAFTTVVVWTLPGRDFLCVEPWTGPANAPNTELAKYLHRRETFRARWSITAL